MTPTEQDKLRREIVGYRIKCDYYLSDRDEGVISQEEYEMAISSELDSVVELFTADRKRVALEARQDELIKAFTAVVGDKNAPSDIRAIIKWPWCISMVINERRKYLSYS